MPKAASSETAIQGPLSPELLAKMDAYWRAADYLPWARFI